jgi:hypothetical protein
MVTAREGQHALVERSARDPLLEAELDTLLRVSVLVVEVHLRHVDLAAQELLGEVGTVVGTVVVGAQDRDVAVESALAKRKRAGVPGATTADDHNPSHLPCEDTRAGFTLTGERRAM